MCEQAHRKTPRFHYLAKFADSLPAVEIEQILASSRQNNAKITQQSADSDLFACIPVYMPQQQMTSHHSDCAFWEKKFSLESGLGVARRRGSCFPKWMDESGLPRRGTTPMVSSPFGIPHLPFLSEMIALFGGISSRESFLRMKPNWRVAGCSLAGSARFEICRLLRPVTTTKGRETSLSPTHITGDEQLSPASLQYSDGQRCALCAGQPKAVWVIRDSRFTNKDKDVFGTCMDRGLSTHLRFASKRRRIGPPQSPQNIVRRGLSRSVRDE